MNTAIGNPTGHADEGRGVRKPLNRFCDRQTKEMNSKKNTSVRILREWNNGS